MVAVPVAPSDVAVERVSDSRHVVSWERHPSSSAPYLGQVVLRREFGPGGWGGVRVVGTVSATSTRFVDNGTKANRAYEWFVEASNRDGKTRSVASATVRTTPDAPVRVKILRRLAGGLLVNYAQSWPGLENVRHEFERQVNGGSWVDVGVVSGDVSFVDDPGPSGYSSLQYRARTVVPVSDDPGETLESVWALSDVIGVPTPPLAPLLVSPVDGAYVDEDEPVELVWEHRPVDGSEQTLAYVQGVVTGGANFTESVTGSDEFLVLPAFGAGVTKVAWGVNTKGLDVGLSPLSPSWEFFPVAKPVVSITSPSSGQGYAASFLTVEWDYDNAYPQERFIAELYRDGGVVERLETISGAGSATFETLLQDGLTYTVQVRARATTGLWSNTVTRAFTVDVELPSPVEVDASWQPETGSVLLEFEPLGIEFEWEGASDDSVSVARGADGAVLARNLIPNPKLTHVGGVTVASGWDADVTIVQGGQAKIVINQPRPGVAFTVGWEIPLPSPGQRVDGVWSLTVRGEGATIGPLFNAEGPRSNVLAELTPEPQTLTAAFRYGDSRPLTLQVRHAQPAAGDTFYISRPALIVNENTEWTTGYFDGDSEPQTQNLDALDVQRDDGDGWVTIGAGIDPQASFVDPVPRLGTVKYRAISISDLPTFQVGPATTIEWEHTGRDPIFVNGGNGFEELCTAIGHEITDTPGIEQDAHQWAGWDKPVAVFGTAETYAAQFQGNIFPHMPHLDGRSTREEWHALLLRKGIVCYRDCQGRKIFGLLNVDFNTASSVTRLNLAVTETAYDEELATGTPPPADLEGGA